MSDDESKNVTFKDKYNSMGMTWQEKAVLISLYHTVMCHKYSNWTITDTSQHFGVSIGLVSENIRLAREIDNGNVKLKECKTREEGLKLIDRRRYLRDRNSTMYKEEDDD